MENSLKSRLLEFIASRRISVRRFEMECGFPNSYVSNLKSNITSKRLDAIVARYPELNVTWLVTGQGAMLNEASAPVSFRDGTASSPDDIERRLSEMNLRMMQTVADLSEREMEMNRRYQNCIDFMLAHREKALAAFEAERARTSELMAHINRIQEQNQSLIEMINSLMCMYHASSKDSEPKASVQEGGRYGKKNESPAQ